MSGKEEADAHYAAAGAAAARGDEDEANYHVEKAVEADPSILEKD
jgi:uncharacterized protein HemY